MSVALLIPQITVKSIIKKWSVWYYLDPPQIKLSLHAGYKREEKTGRRGYQDVMPDTDADTITYQFILYFSFSNS